MHGVVSMLDDGHRALVERVWGELEIAFGLCGIFVTPYPHFSYQVSQYYDLEQLASILQRFAGQSSDFRVRTTGLGIFGGPQPVLFIPVVRSLELSRFHQSLWRAISQTGSGIVNYYHPDQWVPHITLAHGDLDLENLPDVVRFLSGRTFNWEVPVDNIALIYDAGTEQELRIRYEFGA